MFKSLQKSSTFFFFQSEKTCKCFGLKKIASPEKITQKQTKQNKKLNVIEKDSDMFCFSLLFLQGKKLLRNKQTLFVFCGKPKIKP
jgi:hypothetical protein